MHEAVNNVITCFLKCSRLCLEKCNLKSIVLSWFSCAHKRKQSDIFAIDAVEHTALS